jgi:hypothetical protein
MSKNNRNQLFEKLNEFIKKYYQNQLIKGGIYVISILVIFFLLFSIIEYFSSFGVGGRTFLFWSYILLNLIVFGKLLAIPLLHLFEIGKSLNYKEAANIIGKHFPEIDDKLLNVLELAEISDIDNALITASINQKIKGLSPISFKSAIDFAVNKKHIKWALVPVIIVLLFIISGKDYILSESSARIIKHNTFFEPKAPFNYIILNKALTCKQFDDFLLRIKVEGNEIPSEIFIQLRQNTFRLNSLENNEFNYPFSRIHSDLDFQFAGGGYLSKTYTIKSLLQPKVVNMKISISPPKHTNKKRELIENNGDLIISEGSLVNWDIQLENADNCSFTMEKTPVKESTKNQFNIKRQIFRNTNYSIISSNANSLSDTLTYFIKVIRDEFPKINLVQSYDTINKKHLFSGVIEDDYLLTKLEFIYSYTASDSVIFSSEEILIQRKSLEQFFHSVNFEALNIDPGQELSYYFKVWDNDGVNGGKFTNSKVFTYKEAGTAELIKKKDVENEKTKSGLNKSISLADKIQKEIEMLNKKIIEKKKIGWEEKQKAKEILKKQKELEKQITETLKKNSANLKTKEKLNSAMLEKQKQLEDLMNKVLDEEMKRLLEEMEQMIDEADKEKLKDLLEKLNNKNIDLEKELDRELELFKQLEFEQKVEETLGKIAELKQEQEKLKKETQEDALDDNELTKKQEDLNKNMEEVKKDLEDLRQKNMELENKNEIPKTQELEDNIQQNMQESKDALQKGMKKKSKKSQQSAINEMEQLEEKLQSMQQASGEDKPIEDMETLRKILENLITLSFDQEDLMIHLNKTPRNSPEFVKIAQQQKKLSDNSKIIEDSLFALSKRVVEIKSVVNQEISSIKSNMQKSTNELEARDVNRAAERQQFVMTSANNLALLLSEILEQMQKQLEMPPSECNKPKNCNKPNPNCNKPSMSELKKAQKKLNEKMKKCEKGGKGEKKNKRGRQGEKQSKELINLAKKQGQIRKQLMGLRDEVGKNGEKGKIDKILEEMEENERDIINNKITQETINRQEDILTRLLEAENSNREQDKDDKRKSTEWEFELDNRSQELIEYQQQKKAQEELLKTTPVQLAPFYKKKVNIYFNKIIND